MTTIININHWLRFLVYCLVFVPLCTKAMQPAAAPNFTLPELTTNHSIALEDFQGQWVYVDFWASWCAPCRQTFPWMNQLLSEVPEGSLAIIAISVDKKKQDAIAFLKRYPAQFMVAWDGTGKTPAAYDVKGMPSSFLIDPSGNIRTAHLGFKSTDKLPLKETIVRFITGE